MTGTNIDTTSVTSIHGVTNTIKLDQTGDKFSDSTQELVSIIAVSIIALYVICGLFILCIYCMKYIKNSKHNKNVQFMNGVNAIPDDINKNKENLYNDYDKDKVKDLESVSQNIECTYNGEIMKQQNDYSKSIPQPPSVNDEDCNMRMKENVDQEIIIKGEDEETDKGTGTGDNCNIGDDEFIVETKGIDQVFEKNQRS